MTKKSLVVTAILLIGLSGLLDACQAPVNPTPTPATTVTQIADPVTSTPTAIPTAAPTPEPASALGVKPEELRRLSVSFWIPDTNPAAETLKTLALEYNGSNPWGIWVDARLIGSDGELTDRILAGAEGSALPDLVITYPQIALSWETKQQIVVDLEPYVQDPEWGMSTADQSDFYPAFWQPGGAENRKLGIPAMRSAQVMFYNKTWAQALGFSEAPKTPQEFQSQACAAEKANLADTVKTNDGTGGWIARPDVWTTASWIAAFGGQIQADDKGAYTFNTDASRAAFGYLKSMVDKTCAWTARNPEPYDYFANRQAMFYSGTPFDILKQEQVSAGSEIKDAWTVIPFPGQDGQPVVVADGPDFMILQNTPPKQLAAWLFVRWLSGADIQARLVHASGSLPLRAATGDALSAFRSQHPQWAEILAWLPEARSAPDQPSWLRVRPIFQDAAAQLYNPVTTADKVPGILEMLDRTASEILQHYP